MLLKSKLTATLAISLTTMAAAYGVFATTAAAASKTLTNQAVGANYDATVLADNPTFYWPLNETSGPIRDLTGRAAPSSVTNAELGITGAVGNAVGFDGVGQRIQVPYTAAMRLPASFTTEVWAMLSDNPQTTGWPNIFSRGNVLAGHFGAAMWVSSDSTHAVHFKRNGIDVGTTQGLSSTRYRHLAFTWNNDARRWSWYVDGALDTTGVMTGLSGVDIETTPLMIGAMLTATGANPVNYGNLAIDGLAEYGRALTATQVAAHHAAGVAVGTPTPGPTATATASPTPKPTVSPTSKPTPTPTATHKGYTAGISVGDLQPWNARRAADFKAMGDAHSTWIRSDIGWQFVEPTRGDWHFDLFDPVVADARANGMRYLAILHTVPGWANNNGGEYAPPTDLTLETTYCYQTARHFIPLGVTDYELGNEINLSHDGWSSNGSIYAQRYLIPCTKGVRQAAAELGVPANVIFGSLAPTSGEGTFGATFLTDAYNSGAQGQFDSLAWHPYTDADGPVASVNMNRDPAQLNSIMAAHGDGAKKIWATEYGQPTGGPWSVTEQVQAETLPIAFSVWYSKPFAGPLFVYSARDNGTSTADREQHFGMLRYDGSAKPAYAVLASLLGR